MPWLAIPFDNQEKIQGLFNRHRPRGIPSLFVFDNKGNLLSREGKYEIETKGLDAFSYWISLRDN